MANLPGAQAIHVGKRYDSFQEFETALKTYETDNNCVFVTVSSSSIANENKKLIAQGVPADKLYKTDLKHKNIKLTCKFGGDPRIGKGNGLRQFQSTFKIGCPALIHLIARKDFLYIKDFVAEHQNHNCTSDELNIIPEMRKVHEDDLATVSTLIDGNVKPSRIRMLLRGTPSGRVTPRDIANFRAKKKRQAEGGRTKAEMLCDALCHLQEKDPEACIHVHKDSDENLEILFIQSSRMRKNVHFYGSVLLFDHTYKICEERMPVSVLQVMDGNGVGRCAGFGYVVNEEMDTLTVVLRAFRDSIGEAAAERIKTVVIDKDYSEAGAIKAVFPNAQTQLCDFHVTNTLKTRSAKECERVRSIVMEMRYCESDECFQALASEVKDLASKTFYNYFEKNWIQCPLAWSYRDKKKSPHLGNTTTGRLEKLNGTMKLVLNSKTPLHESVHHILEMVQNKEDDVLVAEIGASLKHCYMTKNSDPVVTRMLNELTLYAAKKILCQKEEAVKGVTCRQDTTATSCGCTLYIHTFLPCAHMIQLRLETGLCWYDGDSIMAMYKKSNPGSATDNALASSLARGNPQVTVSIAPAKVVPKTSAQKFNLSLAQGKKIASLLSECGQVQYRRRYQALVDLWNIWAGGKEATVVTLVGEEPINGAGISVEVLEPDNPDNPDNAGIDNNEQEIPVTSSTVTTSKTSNNCNQSLIAGALQDVCPPEVLVKETLCFCGKPCIRLTARPTSKIACRSFWKCRQVVVVAGEERPACSFFRLLSRQDETSLAPPQQSKEKPLTPPQEMPDESEENLAMLIASLDEMFPAMESDSQNGTILGKETVPSEESDPPEVTNFEKETESEKTNLQNNVLRDALKNITLPTAVKHRGRPKGLGKTVHKWSTAKARKARPLLSTEDSQEAKVLACKKRGSKIDNKDVVKSGPQEWTVTSQTDRLKTHFVTKVEISCSCQGAACSRCFSCSCPDFTFKSHIRPCKHIYKVAEMLISDNSNALSLTESPNLEDTSASPTKRHSPFDNDDIVRPIVDMRNVTLRKRRVLSKEEDEVDVKPKLSRKTSGPIEVVTISDSDSDSDSLNKTKAQVLPAGNDCPICRDFGLPKPGGHQCAQCKTAVHAFGCSVPNPGGVEGHGGSDRLCLPCSRKVNGSSTSEVNDKPLPPVHNDICCIICDLPDVGSCRCACCLKYVHAEECSIKKGLEDRICRNCYCLLCKGSFESAHVCLCHVCSLPAKSAVGVICYRCEKIAHPHTCAKTIRAKEKSNELLFICQNCLYALTTNVSINAKAQITDNQMLSDEHMVRASVMLATQFGDKIDGLCAPLGVSYGNRIDKINYYPHRTDSKVPWVQILNTGQHHWVTAVFQKGSSVKIMDSLRSKPISGHTKIQVAMILYSKERTTISRPPCQQQDNGIDCGLYAIANATEFCFTTETQFVDFDPLQLRSHWLKCLETGILTQFPRASKRPKKVKEQEEFEILSTYCKCRLPENYSNLILCDGCSLWYHRFCIGFQEDGENDDEDWFCSDCVMHL